MKKSRSLKFLSGCLALAAACSLQFWLIPFGIHADLALAALVIFAFLFDIWELAIFVLLAVFIMNWQPGLSLDIIAFAFIPFVAYFAARWAHADAWIGAMISIVLSLAALYAVIAPGMIVSSFASFFLDLIISLAVGQLIFWGMEEDRA